MGESIRAVVLGSMDWNRTAYLITGYGKPFLGFMRKDYVVVALGLDHILGWSILQREEITSRLQLLIETEGE